MSVSIASILAPEPHTSLEDRATVSNHSAVRSASIGNILFGAGMLVASRFAPGAAETLAFYVGASFTAFGALGVVAAPYLHFSERRPSMSIDEQYKLN